MRKTLSFLLLVLVLAGMPRSAGAQGAVEVTNPRVEYIFGDHVLFQAQLKAPSGVRAGEIYFAADGAPVTQVDSVTIGSNGQVSYRYNISNASLRPFATVRYNYKFTLDDGQSYTSPQFSFDYIDNRFTWQTLAGDLVNMHWYDGDAAFGQYAADMAKLSIQAISANIPVRLSSPVDVYIYNNSADLQSALGAGAGVAGHTAPDLGVVLVSIAPGPEQRLVMERQIPHELAHVLVYDLVGTNYIRVPAWLREGFSSAMEISPSPDYAIALSQAAGGGSLIPMSDLCQSFPPDMSGTFQAYAQSASFTRYLISQYGSSGIHDLLVAYADGLDCEQGARRALGVSLTQAEWAWRGTELGENLTRTAMNNLMPYLLLLLVIVLVPFLTFLLPHGGQNR